MAANFFDVLDADFVQVIRASCAPPFPLSGGLDLDPFFFHTAARFSRASGVVDAPHEPQSGFRAADEMIYPLVDDVVLSHRLLPPAYASETAVSGVNAVVNKMYLESNGEYTKYASHPNGTYRYRRYGVRGDLSFSNYSLNSIVNEVRHLLRYTQTANVNGSGTEDHCRTFSFRDAGQSGMSESWGGAS